MIGGVSCSLLVEVYLSHALRRGTAPSIAQYPTALFSHFRRKKVFQIPGTTYTSHARMCVMGGGNKCFQVFDKRITTGGTLLFSTVQRSRRRVGVNSTKAH